MVAEFSGVADHLNVPPFPLALLLLAPGITSIELQDHNNLMEDYDYDKPRSGLSPGAAIWPARQPHRFNWGSDKDVRWNRVFQDRARPGDDMQPSPHKQNIVEAEAAQEPLPLRSFDSIDIPGISIEGPRNPKPPDFNDRGVLLDRDMLKPPDRRESVKARLPPTPPRRKMPKGPQPRKRRKRFALPLLLARPSGAATEVMACPDSGSDENIISLELVTSLGLKTEQTSSGEPRQFTVANGNIITAVGQVSTKCRFAVGAPSNMTSIECIFHVFNTLAVPLIMGVDFLQRTETLSKHRDRLVEQSFPAMQALRVNSVGRPKRSLVCRLDTYVGCATVDTGSDLDLVSPKFANSRDFNVEPAFEQVEFADCSVGCTSGVIKTSFTVGNVNSLGFHPRGESIDLELFVLDNLNADVLVGQDTVDMLDVFNLHNESLIPSIPRLGESELNIIRHIGRFEQGAAGLWKKIKKAMGGNQLGSSDGAAGVEAQVDTDQRENARRERERARITKLSGSERQRAQEIEDMVIQAFESGILLRPSAPLGSPTPPTPLASNLPMFPVSLGGESPGSSVLVYHCPVKGCPRGEGGKGFERREDVIRHYQGHGSPGYACPFCPDAEHTYLWPDNLTRHVHVDHMDKDKNDPLLKKVLAQRFKDPNEVRKRRALPPEVLYRSL